MDVLMTPRLQSRPNHVKIRDQKEAQMHLFWWVFAIYIIAEKKTVGNLDLPSSVQENVNFTEKELKIKKYQKLSVKEHSTSITTKVGGTATI